MYNPPHFAETQPEELFPAIRERGAATLVTAGPDGLDAAFVPLEVDAGLKIVRCHVARPNPIWRAVQASSSVLMIVNGVDHYISPGWYPSKAAHGRVVPTWNYEVIHIHGIASVFEETDRLLAHLNALTDSHEEKFPAPWKVGDAPDDFIERQMRGIVGLEIVIERIEGKRKLGQNRSDADRKGAIAGLETMGTPESRAAAAAMKRHRPGQE